MEKIHWVKFVTFKYSLSEIIDYFRGNIRYFAYYNYYFTFLIRDHIHEQIDLRINFLMDKQCYHQGSCKICGCKTTNLQMANKTCDAQCYPKMMNKSQWKKFKNAGTFISDDYLWYNLISVSYFTSHNFKFLIKTKFK